MITGYRAWRHTHGYGVHSPYAYMLVTEVLDLPGGYAYYDEPLWGSDRMARALLRYAHRFGYAGCEISASVAEDIRQRLADSIGAETPGKPCIRILDANKDEFVADENLLPEDCILAVRGNVRRLASELMQSNDSGVLFYDPSRGLIYFPNPKMRFVAYEYRF